MDFPPGLGPRNGSKLFSNSKPSMKNYITSFIICLVFSWGVLAARADAVQDGNAAMAKGDYSAAVRSYEAALAANPPSAGLYANLATAQMKAGEKPEAALSLRRSLMLDPRQADVRMALSDLERSQGVPFAGEGWRSQLAQKVSLPALIVFGCIVFWIAAFLLLVAFSKKFRALSWVGVFLLLFFGMALFAAGVLADPKVTGRQAGVIMAGDGVTLLSAPADQSDSVTKLPAAACVQILHRNGEWTYCQAPTGQKGWMASSAVQAVVPAS